MITIAPSRCLTREQLRAIPVPTAPRHQRSPQAESHWAPIQHGELADALIEELGTAGYELLAERWCTRRDDLQLLGAVEVRCLRGPEQPEMPEGIDLSVVLRHGNDSFYALTLAGGATVGCCDNGLLVWSADNHVVSRRHLIGLDWRSTIRDLVAELHVVPGLIIEAVGRLRTHRADRCGGDAFTVEAAIQGVYPWGVGRVVTELWWKRKADTLWDWTMAVTQAIQRRSPADQLDSQQRLRQFLAGL